MTAGELAADLLNLGLRPGDAVLAHTSLSSIGWVDGGAESVVEALLRAVSPGGTLLFPGLTGSAGDSSERPPRADLREDPAPWVGKIPAAANRHPHSCRSIHPTRSVIALGTGAERWIEGHERCDTPCGVGSPYHRLAQEGGKILLLGCRHTRNTSLQMVEEVAEVPYHLLEGAVEGRVIDRKGCEHIVTTRLHHWDVPRGFDRIDALLGSAQTMGHVGQANCRLVDAREQLRLVSELLEGDSYALCET